MGKGGENQIQEQYSPEKRMQFWMFLDVLDLLVRIGMKASIINNKYNKYHVTPPPLLSTLLFTSSSLLLSYSSLSSFNSTQSIDLLSIELNYLVSPFILYSSPPQLHPTQSPVRSVANDGSLSTSCKPLFTRLIDILWQFGQPLLLSCLRILPL
jgi:hypothetical protein